MPSANDDKPKPPTAREIGAYGERVAVVFLKTKGFEIVTTNYRTRYGEIDIIATDSEYLVFAEVKTRRNTNYGLPTEAVDFRKQAKLRKTADRWMQSNQHVLLQPRFDIIEVYTTDPNLPAVRWIPNAF